MQGISIDGFEEGNQSITESTWSPDFTWSGFSFEGYVKDTTVHAGKTHDLLTPSPGLKMKVDW